MYPKLAAGLMILLILSVVFAMAAVLDVAAASGAEAAIVSPITHTMRHNTLPSGVSAAVKSNPDWIKLPGHVVSKITNGHLHIDLVVHPTLFKSANNRFTVKAALDTKNYKEDMILWLYINSFED